MVDSFTVSVAGPTLSGRGMRPAGVIWDEALFVAPCRQEVPPRWLLTVRVRPSRSVTARRWRWSARAGLVAYGLVHLLIGWLALNIAWSGPAGKSADTSGAMDTLAAQPFGRTLLWVVAVGLVALGLWQVSEATWGHRHRRGVARVREKITSAAMALVYFALGVSAVSVALGSGVS